MRRWRASDVSGAKGIALGLLCLASGTSFLIFRSILHPLHEVDFRFFWLAGTLWGQGVDPYGSTYASAGRALLSDGNTVRYWFYPPQWWAVCRLLALTDLTHALMAWRLITSVVVVISTALLVRSMPDETGYNRWPWVAGFSGVAALVEPTANLLAFGQSSALLYAGLCLIARGVIRQGQGWVSAGLLLTSFKPQVGALLIAAFLLVPRYRAAVIAALVAATILALPQFVRHGFFATVSNVLAALRGWGALPSNTALSSSGPVNLLARLGSLAPNPQWQTFAAAAAILSAAWLLRSREGRPLPALWLLTASIPALIPLHIYDFTILMVPCCLALASDPRFRPLVWIAIAMMFRPGKVENLFHLTQYGGGVSLGLIGLSGASLLLWAGALYHILSTSASRGSKRMRQFDRLAMSTLPLRARKSPRA